MKKYLESNITFGIWLLIFFWIFIAFVSFSHAQTTAVTATITAPDGQAFANGTVSAVFTPSTGLINQNLYKINGVGFPYIVNGTIDGTGTFVITLTDDHQVRPFGGRWNFIVCSAASIPCTQSLQDVFGASINLSGLISSDVKNFSGSSLGLPKFYTDNEASTITLGGNLYYRLTSNSVRLWTGIGGWVDLAGTGGGSFVALTPSVSQKIQPDAGHSAVIPLTLQCPIGAAAGLQCAQVLDSAGNVIGQWTNDGQAMIPKLNGTIYCGLPVTDLGATLSAAIVAANTLGQGEIDCSNIPFAVNMSTGVNANVANIYIRLGVMNVSVTGTGAAHWTIQGNNQQVRGAGVGLTTWDTSQVTGTTIFFQVGSGSNTTNNSLFTDMSFIGNRVLVCGAGGANNFCRTGGGDAHHGMTQIKVGTNPPTIQTNVVFERISISNAGFIGLQVDNCTTCALRNSFFDHTWSSAIQVNSSQVTANAVFGGLYIGNVLIDTNVGCGIIASPQNCGDGEFNLIASGGYQALGPTRVEANYIQNTAGALCNSTVNACSWDNTKSCSGGGANDTGCGQGIQSTYNAWKVDIIGNSVYHTPNEGIAATGSATVTGNHVEDNSCCAGGAGGIVDYVDPQGFGKGFVASGNVVKDGGYCFSLQLGAVPSDILDSAIVDGINFSGNDCEGTGAGGTSVQNAFRIRNNCITCVTHNSTLNHIVFSNNSIHGSINNVFQQIDPTTVASGVGIFTDNTPNVKTGQQQIINANNARTNFSITTGNTNLMTYPKGIYLVTYIFQTHTAAGGAGTATLTFNYTDNNNHTKSVGPFSIDTTHTDNTGITQGSFVGSLDPVISASKDITFTIGGTIGAGGTYDAYITMEPFSQTQ